MLAVYVAAFASLSRHSGPMPRIGASWGAAMADVVLAALFWRVVDTLE
jgi:hypothetical protein